MTQLRTTLFSLHLFIDSHTYQILIPPPLLFFLGGGVGFHYQIFSPFSTKSKELDFDVREVNEMGPKCFYFRAYQIETNLNKFYILLVL